MVLGTSELIVSIMVSVMSELTVSIMILVTSEHRGVVTTVETCLCDQLWEWAKCGDSGLVA